MKAELPARPGLAGTLFLLGGTLLLLRPLAAFWSVNANYGYGWGVPFLAAYLLIERWRCRPDPRPVRPGNRMLAGLGVVAFAWALGFIAVRLILETEPESRPLLWVDGCLAAGAWLAWFGLLGGGRWCRHFAVPVLFVLVGVPWIFRCEFFVTQGLMRLNAAWVAASLTWLDVPAHAAGSTIMLATGQLGVTEACSGIRSLQAALMMALFFGEFYRFGVRGRGALLGMGAALALLGNHVRMLFLAWRGAHHGMASVESAHDSAGWLILGFTVVSLWLICLAVRPAPASSRPTPRELSPLARRMALRWAACILAATFFAEAATQSWYGWRERSAPRFRTWTVAWPADAPGFRRLPIAEEVHADLHDEASSAAAWRDPEGRSWTGWWIRYRAGAAGKIVFESHNPALCLPAAGWKELPGGSDFALTPATIRLPVHSDIFTSGQETVYVFWVPYLDRGARAGADDAPGVYGHSLQALVERKLPWLRDVWTGCRGADAETLEVAVRGAAGYAEAERAFRQVVANLIRPDASLMARSP